MDIEIFTLCDAASDAFGKLSLLGAFDTILSKQAPVAHPQCSIALRVRFVVSEQGAHRIKISIIDYDGKQVVAPMEIPIEAKVNQGFDHATVNVVGNIRDLSFPQFGKYRIDLTIDGRLAATLPVTIVKHQ